jgi:single-strand DNA-binding protein
MSTLNKCLFIGNLTRNVILAKTGSDLSVCNFTLAVSSLRKKPQGAPLFMDCTAWKKTAEFLTEKAAKGDQVMVEGHMEPQSWADATTGANRTKLVLHVHSLELIRRATNRAASPNPGEAPATEEAPDSKPSRNYRLNRRSKAPQEQAA